MSVEYVPGYPGYYTDGISTWDTGEPSPLPEDWYNFRVVNAEWKSSQKGNMMFALTAITSNDFGTTQVRAYVMTPDDGPSPSTYEFLSQVFGLPVDSEYLGNTSAICGFLDGQRFSGHLKPKSGGYWYQTIDQFKAIEEITQAVA